MQLPIEYIQAETWRRDVCEAFHAAIGLSDVIQTHVINKYQSKTQKPYRDAWQAQCSYSMLGVKRLVLQDLVTFCMEDLTSKEHPLAVESSIREKLKTFVDGVSVSVLQGCFVQLASDDRACEVRPVTLENHRQI
jgi:hypothetical protein